MKIYLAIGSLSTVPLFKEEGVERVLVSYYEVNGRADIKLPFEDVMLDSGAYSVEHTQKRVSLQAYGLWLELYISNYPQIKNYANLDNLSDYQETERNQSYLESLGLCPIPVYHYGESTEVLDKLCNKYEYVGLGGMAIGQMPSKNLKRFWEFVYSKYKDNKFHFFGVGTMFPFADHQPFSLDSASWSIYVKYGHILIYKDGLPSILELSEKEGYKTFLKIDELRRNNIRAFLDYEKLEWVNNKKGELNQPWLI